MTALDRHGVSGRQILIVAVIMFALVIDGLDIQLLALTSPVIIAEWGTAAAAFGPAMGAALIGMAFGASLGGWLGDRVGRKTVLVGATFLFGCATAAASLTGNVAELALLRLVTGLGFGAAAPNGIALASEWLPPRARPMAAVILSTSTPFGGVVGAGAVLLLLPTLGWTGCFILCGVVTVAVSLIMAMILAESPSFLAATGARAAAVAAAAAPGSAAIDPVDPLPERIFTRERLRFNAAVWTQFFCINFIAFSMAAWTPVMLTARGFSMGFALQATLAHSLIAVIGTTLISFVLGRLGSRRLMLACCATGAVALSALAFLLSGPSVPEGGIAGLAVIGCTALVGGAIGGAIGITFALVAHVYPTSCRARGIGSAVMMGRFGGVVSTLIGGTLLSLRGADPTPYLSVLASCAVVGVLAITIIDRHIPKAA